MIEIEGLTKHYGEITALNDVSFSVEKGQIVGFLGANGAGKTTTMDILCGCIGADSGRACIAGFDVTEEPESAKAKLGYLPDEPPLYNDMRVREYISYAARLHKVGSADLKKRVDETMETLSLTDVKDRLVGNLSKGYRQRVGLAQAIVHDPDVLVLDEPTEGLDPNQIIHIRSLIKSLAGRHTILLSSHILSEVQNTCDHIVIIHEGRVIQKGTYEELVQQIGTGGHYRLRVARNYDTLCKELSKMSGISEVEPVDTRTGQINFYYDGRDEGLDAIAKLAVENSCGLKELASNTRSLEEVFIQLTH